MIYDGPNRRPGWPSNVLLFAWLAIAQPLVHLAHVQSRGSAPCQLKNFIETHFIPRYWIPTRLRFINWSHSLRERNWKTVTEMRNHYCCCSMFQQPNQHIASIRGCENHDTFEAYNHSRKHGKKCNDIGFRTSTYSGNCWRNSMPRWYFNESDTIGRCKFFSIVFFAEEHTNDANSNARLWAFEIECLNSPIKPLISSSSKYWSIWYSREPSDGKAEHWNAFRWKWHLQCWTSVRIHFFYRMCQIVLYQRTNVYLCALIRVRLVVSKDRTLDRVYTVIYFNHFHRLIFSIDLCVRRLATAGPKEHDSGVHL